MSLHNALPSSQAAYLLGILLAFTGAGALIGSLFVASLPDRRRGMWMIVSIAIFAVAMLGFAASENIWISLGIGIIIGVGQAGRQDRKSTRLNSSHSCAASMPAPA